MYWFSPAIAVISSPACDFCNVPSTLSRDCPKVSFACIKELWTPPKAFSTRVRWTFLDLIFAIWAGSGVNELGFCAGAAAGALGRRAAGAAGAAAGAGAEALGVPCGRWFWVRLFHALPKAFPIPRNSSNCSSPCLWTYSEKEYRTKPSLIWLWCFLAFLDCVFIGLPFCWTAFMTLYMCRVSLFGGQYTGFRGKKGPGVSRSSVSRGRRT